MRSATNITNEVARKSKGGNDNGPGSKRVVQPSTGRDADCSGDAPHEKHDTGINIADSGLAREEDNEVSVNGVSARCP